MSAPNPSSLTPDYAARLQALATPRWKRWLDVQAPYRWNLRRLNPGRTLDVGCGVGRNLRHLDGQGVGVDPNASCVAEARRAGLEAYTPEDFACSPHATGGFDSLLLAHVIEHIGARAGAELVAQYLPYLKPGGQVILITPQSAGYASDATHVEFIDAAALSTLAEGLGLAVTRNYSFPFPPIAGKVFLHNEFVLTARAPGSNA